MYLFHMGRQPVVAISESKWCEQVLRDRPAGFSRSAKLARIFGELGTNGVFSAEGEAWRQQRKLAVSALAQRNLRPQFKHLLTVADRLCKRWEGLADAGVALDLVDEFKRFTVDATTLIAFGHDANTIEQGDDIVQRQLELVFPTFSRRLFALVPLWRVLRLPADRRVDRALSDLMVWLDGLVAETRARLAQSQDTKPSNFMEAMLLARDDEGEPFPNEVLFANLMTMLLAGEDTTAHTLAWAVHHLCECPEAVDQLRHEADGAIGTSRIALDVEVTSKLAWAGAVADETMRLRPVAPIMFSDALADTVIGDLRIPKGTKVVLLSRPGAVDAGNFEEPLAFRPQRWLGDAQGAHDTRANIPFGSGPRICPGRSLALIEMKLILSMLYKSFDVTRVGNSDDVHEAFSFTMIPTGLEVQLQRRGVGP